MNSVDILDHDDEFHPAAQGMAGLWPNRVANRKPCNIIQPDDGAVTAD